MGTSSDVYSLKSFEFDSTAPSVTIPILFYILVQAAEILRDASSSSRQHGIAVFSFLKCLRETNK